MGVRDSVVMTGDEVRVVVAQTELVVTKDFKVMMGAVVTGCRGCRFNKSLPVFCI